MKNELILQWERGFVKAEEYRGVDGNRLGLEGGGQVAEAGAADPAAGGGAGAGRAERGAGRGDPAAVWAGALHPAARCGAAASALRTDAAAGAAAHAACRLGPVAVRRAGAAAGGISERAGRRADRRMRQRGRAGRARDRDPGDLVALHPHPTRDPASAGAASAAFIGLLSAGRPPRQRQDDAAAQLHPRAFGGGQPRRRCGRAAGAGGRGAWRAAVRPRPAHGRALRLPEGRRHADAAARDEPGVAGRGRDHKPRRPRRDPAGLRLRRAHPCDHPRGLRRGAAGKAPVPGRPRGRDV